MDLLMVIIACCACGVVGAVIGAHVGVCHIARHRTRRRVTATVAQLNGRLSILEAALSGYRHVPDDRAPLHSAKKDCP
jgi:hypothetical protein